MVILNAGWTKMNPWEWLEDQHLQDICMINSLHPAYLAKVMTPQLTARLGKKGERGALVFVSSLASMLPNTGNLTYSATKTFCSYLGEGLFYELKDTVDVLNYMPSSVATNLTAADTQQGGDYITPDRSAEVTFRDLAVEPNTCGDWKHHASRGVMEMFPRSTLLATSIVEVKKHLKKVEDAEKEKAANTV